MFYIKNNNLKKHELSQLVNRFHRSGYDIPNPFPNSLPQFFGKKDNVKNTIDSVGKLLALPLNHLVTENNLSEITTILKNSN